MVEFALNSSISATTGFAPFELNHGYVPIVGQRISTDTKYTGVKQFAQQVLWNLMVAHDAIIEYCVMQMHHANKRRWPDEIYRRGDLVYLSTKNLAPTRACKETTPQVYWAV
jgi:hypothetical protein